MRWRPSFLLPAADRKLSATVRTKTGVTPVTLAYYREALTARSAKDLKPEDKDNERLEFLGDAVLGSVVADFVYKKFPKQSEGFLSNARSRLVSRECLNEVAKKTGFHEMMLAAHPSGLNENRPTSLYGNALEAFIGALYLDKGYLTCEKYIVGKLYKVIDVQKTIQTDTNYKGKLVSWARKNKKQVVFQMKSNKKVNNRYVVTVEVLVDNKAVAEARGGNKKRAEQNAAEAACEAFSLK